MADPGDSIIEILGSINDANLHAEKINWNIAPIDFWESDGIFFGRQNRFGAAAKAAIDHVEDFLLGVPVMVGIAAPVDDVGAEVAEAILETFRCSNARERSHVEVLQRRERGLLAGKDILNVERLVGAFNNFRPFIILPERFAEFVSAKLATLRDKNIAGTFEIGDRLAECAAG